MGRIALPIPDPDSRPFWQACSEGRLIAQACSACREPRFPPSPVCPRCRSQDYTWEELSGRGEVWTFTIVHHPFRPWLEDQVPYVVGLIRLDEGPRVIGRISATREPSIGSRVRVRFQEMQGTHLPCFELEDNASQ